MELQIEFGSALRRARKEAGLSMKMLAAHVNVTVPYVSHLEAGRTRPSAEMVRRLARACSADEDELALLAGHVPSDVMAILYANPKRAVAMLRENFVVYEKEEEV